MKRTKTLSVLFDDGNSRKKVGTLALYQDRLAAFEYADSWLIDGFSISPLSLPLEKKVFLPDYEPFDGVFGVFNDSLPDGWGRLLFDRLLRKNHIDPFSVSVLDRLSVIGSGGAGALVYEPEEFLGDSAELPADYDEIAAQCSEILSSQKLQDSDSEKLDALFCAGGSSGGARPKVFVKINGEDWIVKFPSSSDPKEIGRMEYEYSLCAQKCGIQTGEVRLFPSKVCGGYFGTKRFDRNPRRLHLISASALLETSHRIPNLDYETLFLLNLKLTKNAADSERLFRQMCFNVFAHNRDDHSKNFSWLYDHSENRWHLSPAYDLTFSNSIGGEHATTIHGEGKNPTIKDILAVAEKSGFKEKWARRVAEEIENHVRSDLREWVG